MGFHVFCELVVYLFDTIEKVKTKLFLGDFVYTIYKHLFTPHSSNGVISCSIYMC